MNLTLGFSTCPNDTFIFDAVVNGRIDCEGLRFEPVLADVEQLNKAAFNSEIHITKLSFHAFAYAAKHYVLSDSGSALGYKNGPLLISKKKIYPDEISQIKVAIPGKYTTANLLFSIFSPECTNKKEYVFSEIEDAILDGEVDAGLIIHENRFTYEHRGLQKIVDLGEIREKQTQLPIPLGGIAINRNLPGEIIHKISRIIGRSVEFAFEHPEASTTYIKKYAQDMEEIVQRKHIDLYVNNFTQNLGDIGKKAVEKLYSDAAERNIIPKFVQSPFLDSIPDNK